MCRVCVCVFFCMCFCLSHFVGLCFWCIVRFSSFDCVYFLFVFILCLYVLFCFQFSLPITKYFVCFAYNWMFLLALSHLFASTKVLFLLCFVSDSCLRLPCGWCLLLWPSADAAAFTACGFFLLCLCGCCLLILSHLNIWINVLDFSLLFNDFFLLFCLECKSSRVFFSILFLSFRLFLSLSMLLLF